MDNKLLIEWYRQNQRDLPWRQTTDPYVVWLSEIILQQTRVAQGLPYFNKFIEKYPTIFELAKANEQEVLNLWQGLGYYSRARNLHFTAKDIVSQHSGKFPKRYKNLLKLKGVGDYTAAAIASFCYQERVPVVDGNVYRVLSRIFGIDTPINTPEGQKMIKAIAVEQIDQQSPGVYNQAIMEFGALHCTPANPKCNNCPLSGSCIAFQTGKQTILPIKIKKIKIKKRTLNYFLVRYQNQIILEKREGAGIWQNLFQLPLVETETINKAHLDDLYKKYGISSTYKPVKLVETTHKLTHQHLKIYFWELKSDTKPDKLVALNTLKNYPMPIVIANFLDNYAE